jgi:hypothetical protein
MSGVEVTKKVNEDQTNICTSCMNTVVQTFDYLRKQIVNLNIEKTQLLIDIKNLKKEQENEKRIASKKIKELKDQLKSLRKI